MTKTRQNPDDILRAGDKIAIESMEGFDVCTVDKVEEGGEGWEGFLKVKLSEEKKPRYIQIEKIQHTLVTRSEDVQSKAALDLRVKEVMLVSQMQMMQAQSCPDLPDGVAKPYFSAYEELDRTLSAVHARLDKLGYRTTRWTGHDG